MPIYLHKELPSAYQEVEYVESSGTQYIKTGLNICDGYRHTQKIRFLTTQSNSYIISGGYLGQPVTSTFMRFYFGGPQSNGQWTWGYLGDAPGQPGHQTGGSGGSANVDYNLDICWISGNAYYKVNDTTLMSNSSTWTTSLAGECTLFGGYAEDSNPHYIPYPGGVRIYDSKFYNANGTLVRDFIPCYRKSDNVIGMYDLVTNQFYTNSGTGTFTKGNNVNTNKFENLSRCYLGDQLLVGGECGNKVLFDYGDWTNAQWEITGSAEAGTINQTSTYTSFYRTGRHLSQYPIDGTKDFLLEMNALIPLTSYSYDGVNLATFNGDYIGFATNWENRNQLMCEIIVSNTRNRYSKESYSDSAKDYFIKKEGNVLTMGRDGVTKYTNNNFSFSPIYYLNMGVYTETLTIYTAKLTYL